MPRPTEVANVRFVQAGKHGLAVTDLIMQNPSDPLQHGAALVILGQALAELAVGMAEVSNGLRATYILLERYRSRPDDRFTGSLSAVLASAAGRMGVLAAGAY
jgi:hypothetical protein